MVDGVGTNSYTYTAGNQLLSEGGVFANDTVTNGYVNRLRTALGLKEPGGEWTNGFSWDAARRITAGVRSGPWRATQGRRSRLSRDVNLRQLANRLLDQQN